MALATVAISTGGAHPYPLNAGMLPIAVTFTATAYATATGGFLVDISAVLNAYKGTPSSTAPIPQRSIAFSWADVAGVIVSGGYVDGTLGSIFAGIPVKTATSGQFTIRAYSSAATEITDGNKTGTIFLWVILDAGGSSYTNYV